MIEKIPGPDRAGREAMYYPQGQEQAHRSGAYGYLDSIAMAPRLAAIAAYVHKMNLRSIIDIGCGTAELLDYLDRKVAYVGVDIAQSAIDAARKRFAKRRGSEFHQSEFRAWQGGEAQFDGAVWAGIGCAWTYAGRRGDFNDWCDILFLADRALLPQGCLICELVTPHLPALERRISGAYHCIAGCDLDCFQSQESPRRSIRVFQRVACGERPIVLGHQGTSLIPCHIARELIGYSKAMGQATDEQACNLGFGYVYYGLVRLLQPEVVVSVGSLRGFAPTCLALGCVDNRRGNCWFVDPGKVDKHWHDPRNVERLRGRFRLGNRLRHVRTTTREALESGSIPECIDLALIDGDHSYQGVKFDFDQLGARVRRGGMILLHDSVAEGVGYSAWDVKQFVTAEVQGDARYEILTLPISAGLTLVRKK